MNRSLFIFAAVLAPMVSSAHQNPIQLQCRKLEGTAAKLAPDESLMHGMACREVKPTSPAMEEVSSGSQNPIRKPVKTTETAVKPDTAGRADNMKIIAGS